MRVTGSARFDVVAQAEHSSDPAVDREGLARFLGERFPEFGGPFAVERLGEGQSCLTFLIRGDGWEVVLRRPPRGNLPPTAFDVTREYRVMSALHGAGTPVPVPAPFMGSPAVRVGGGCLAAG